MLRNNLSNVTSADRFDHPAPAAGGNRDQVSTKSPYTNLINASQSRPTSHILGALTPPVKMCLAATFAILFLLVAFSFALEEYSDGDVLLSSLRGGRADQFYSGSAEGAMIKNASTRKVVPRHQAFSRSVIW